MNQRRARSPLWLCPVGLVLLAGCQSVLDYDNVTFGDDGGASEDASAGFGGVGGTEAGGSAGAQTGGAAGAQTGGAAGAQTGGASGAPAGGAGGTGGTSTGGSGGTSTGGSGGTSTGGSGGTSTGGSGGSTTDPYEAYRQECIDKINELRATKGLSAYSRWTSAEACVDDQASHDAEVGIAHDAFSKNLFPACNGYAQNECPGWGASAISSCLESMWAEGDQPGCAGCDACDTFEIFQGNCPDCTFNGAVVCGHYVNMTSKTFGQAACGFSDQGGWAAINFQ